MSAPNSVEARPSARADSTALTSLLPEVVTATVVTLVAFVAARGAHGAKSWDRALFATLILVAAGLCVRFLVRPPARTAHLVTSSAAALGLLVGTAAVERRYLTLWGGFGVSVAVVALCLVAFLWRVLDRVEASPKLRTALSTVVALVAVCDLASLIRTLSNFVDVFDNVYVLNEMLAPAAGRVPDATSVPQYVGLYGWLLVPFRHFLSPWGLAQTATIFLSALAVSAVVLAVAMAYRSMTRPALWIAAGIVVPLTCVMFKHGTYNFYSSIASYLPELPIRIFPAMLVSFLGIEELARIRQGSVRSWHLLTLGALTGLIVWNSQDFGLAITVAYFLVLAIALPPKRLRSSMSSWTAGVVAGLAAYPLIAFVSGTPVRFADFALFSRAFASGYLAVLIQVPGPVLFVLPTLVASAAVGWCLLLRQRGSSPDPEMHDRAALTLALVSTWSLGGFAYYLNRSYASEFLQILLMPCGVCIVALLSLARDARARALRSDARARSRSWRFSLTFLPIALLASVGFASVLQSPSPYTTVTNLRDGPYPFEATVIPSSTLRAARNFVQRRGGTLGYFGNNGSYVHLVTGLPNPLLYDDPTQLTYSPALRDAGCRYLAAHATTWLITSVTDDTPAGPDVCGTYRPVHAAGLPPHTLFLRTK